MDTELAKARDVGRVFQSLIRMEKESRDRSLEKDLAAVIDFLNANPAAETITIRGESVSLMKLGGSERLLPLFRFDGLGFAVNAYRLILKRNPDGEGLKANCLWALEEGASKLEFAKRLRESTEASSLAIRFRDADRGLRLGGQVFFHRAWDGPRFGECVIAGMRAVFKNDIRESSLLSENLLELIDSNFDKVRQDLRALKEELRPGQIEEHHLVEARPYFEIATENADLKVGRFGEEHREDFIYYMFENVFYDSEYVRRKQRLYLPFLEDAKASENLFLDLGCGRGEFISLLQESGIGSQGVEINRIETDILREKGHQIENADLFRFLDGSDSTWAGVSMIHVIEHLETEKVIGLFDILYAKIEEGGRLVIETINPHCPLSFASFYMDHTHVKPYAAEVIAFHMQRVGFKDVKILYTNLIAEPHRVADKCRNFHDFGVIGTR